MSQMTSDKEVHVAGVILNVPVTCHPKFFPRERYEYTSYEQCEGTLLSSEEMRQMWEVVCPDESRGKEPMASPLLGSLKGLPKHLVFVAGQDPLRDEALAYVSKLEEEGVNVKWHIYPGVPHTFADIWELETTKKFQKDLVDGMKDMLI